MQYHMAFPRGKRRRTLPKVNVRQVQIIAFFVPLESIRKPEVFRCF